MSSGKACTCKPQDISKWAVIQYKCNFSAFNGRRRAASDYSLLVCSACGHAWRTRAAYVDAVCMQGTRRSAELLSAQEAK